MTDAAEILKRKRTPRTVVRVCLAPDLLADHESLHTKVERAKTADNRPNRENERLEAPPLERQLVALEDRISSEEVEFTFEAMARAELQALLDDCPPNPETDIDQSGRLMEFNTDKFVPRLLAESCIDPALDLEQAQLIYDEWSDAEVAVLFRAAYNLNRQVRNASFTRPAGDEISSSEPS